MIFALVNLKWHIPTDMVYQIFELCKCITFQWPNDLSVTHDLCMYTHLLLSSSVIPHLRSTSCTLMKCFLPRARSSGKTNRVRTSLSPCMSRNVEEINTLVFLQLKIHWKTQSYKLSKMTIDYIVKHTYNKLMLIAKWYLFSNKRRTIKKLLDIQL